MKEMDKEKTQEQFQHMKQNLKSEFPWMVS